MIFSEKAYAYDASFAKSKLLGGQIIWQVWI